MIKFDTILSSFDDKITLLQWLKQLIADIKALPDVPTEEEFETAIGNLNGSKLYKHTVTLNQEKTAGKIATLQIVSTDDFQYDNYSKLITAFSNLHMQFGFVTHSKEPQIDDSSLILGIYTDGSNLFIGCIRNSSRANDLAKVTVRFLYDDEELPITDTVMPL